MVAETTHASLTPLAHILQRELSPSSLKKTNVRRRATHGAI